MRVSDSMRFQSASQRLMSVRSQHAEASERALTGQRVNSPSDDPMSVSQLLELQSRTSRAGAQRSAISAVQGDVELAEGMLAEAGALLQRAHELSVQGASDQNDAQGRSAIALELQGVYDELLAIANTEGSNGYLFAGSQKTTQPFDATATFVADDLAHNVDVGSSSPVRVNASGAQAFTAAGGRDIFADLSNVITALNADDGATVRANLTNLQDNHDQIQAERSSAGVLLNRLQTSDEALSRMELLGARESETLGAADPFEAYSEFVALGQTLDRSIAVTRELLNLSTLQ